jgi:hypothetical protein
MGQMVKSVQYRKASLLKSLVDEMQWWDMQGHLYVKGHTLGALMEDLDQYKQSGQADMAAAAQYLQRCSKMNADFETWYEQVVKESPSPMFWKSVPPGEEPTMMFANLYRPPDARLLGFAAYFDDNNRYYLCSGTQYRA